MTREAVASALDEAAEALARAAHALRGMEPSAARADVQDRVPSRPAAAEAGVPPAPASAPLGLCPKHGIPWTVKAGGVSKAGKSYKAFWKCDSKDADEERGYCQQKPEFGWVKTHPPEQSLVSEDEVPF